MASFGRNLSQSGSRCVFGHWHNRPVVVGVITRDGMLTRLELFRRKRIEHPFPAGIGHRATLNISESLRAASACDISPRYAARLTGSPPLASLRAKSAQRPVLRLTEKEPGRRRSTRLGFLAIHSLPRRKPSGSHRARSVGRQVESGGIDRFEIDLAASVSAVYCVRVFSLGTR